MKSGMRILVIDDEPQMVEMMIRVLNHVGCEAAGAPNGSEGLKLAENGRFDLITLDVDMPGMNGFEVCSRLKRVPQLQQTPVIFITGRFGDEDVQRGREVGAADYITKPFDLQTFLSKLRSHTRTASTGHGEAA